MAALPTCAGPGLIVTKVLTPSSLSELALYMYKILFDSDKQCKG